MSECAFNLDHYSWILDRALDLGYRFTRLDRYHDDRGVGRMIILRHDVDLSLVKALEMAELEAKRDIQATFFVRVHARDFNPFSRENYAALRRLMDLDCEIALQHEAGVFPVPDEEASGLFERELGYLESAIGRKVVGATVHMPKRAISLFDPETIVRCGVQYDASGREFNEDTKFVSDSNQIWKESCLCQMLGGHERLYVNIHPVWWFPLDATAEEIRRYLVEGN